MAVTDGRFEGRLESYAAEVATALGPRLVCVALYGSAVGRDWIVGHSDINTAIVVDAVATPVLDALVPVVARWRTRGFALPLVVDREYLARARDVFPIELDDLRRQHRVLHGEDVLATLQTDPEAARRECEYEARGKLLRLRTMYLAHAESPETLSRLMHRSLTSFLTLLRQLLRVRGQEVGDGYELVLGAGERALGPLPAIRAGLARRGRGDTSTPADAARAFTAYLADVERLVAAVDELGA